MVLKEGGAGHSQLHPSLLRLSGSPAHSSLRLPGEKGLAGGTPFTPPTVEVAQHTELAPPARGEGACWRGVGGYLDKPAVQNASCLLQAAGLHASLPRNRVQTGGKAGSFIILFYYFSMKKGVEPKQLASYLDSGLVDILLGYFIMKSVCFLIIRMCSL